MNRIVIASEILKIAKELMAIEFDTEKEKKKYQQEHEVRPGTKLTVKKDSGGDSQPPVEEFNIHHRLAPGISQHLKKFHPENVRVDRDGTELLFDAYPDTKNVQPKFRHQYEKPRTYSIGVKEPGHEGPPAEIYVGEKGSNRKTQVGSFPPGKKLNQSNLLEWVKQVVSKDAKNRYSWDT